MEPFGTMCPCPINLYESLKTQKEVINATGSGTKNLRYEIDVRCAPVVDPNNLGGSSSGPQYNDSYQPFAKLQFGGEGWTTGNTHTPAQPAKRQPSLNICRHT